MACPSYVSPTELCDLHGFLHEIKEIYTLLLKKLKRKIARFQEPLPYEYQEYMLVNAHKIMTWVIMK